MQQFSTQTYQFAHTYHLGMPLAAYRAAVTFSILLYTLLGAVLVGGLIVQRIRLRQWVVVLPILLILLLLLELWRARCGCTACAWSCVPGDCCGSGTTRQRACAGTKLHRRRYGS